MQCEEAAVLRAACVAVNAVVRVSGAYNISYLLTSIVRALCQTTSARSGHSFPRRPALLCSSSSVCPLTAIRVKCDRPSRRAVLCSHPLLSLLLLQSGCSASTLSYLRLTVPQYHQHTSES